MSRKAFAIATLTGTCLLSALIVYRTVAFHPSIEPGGTTFHEARRNRIPFAFRPLCAPLFDLHSPEAQLVDRLTASPPHVPLTGAVLCHYLRIFGQRPIPVKQIDSGKHAIEILTSSDESSSHFGQRMVFRTREGARFMTIPVAGRAGVDGESHRDLFLATLAEQGVPLTQPIQLDETATTLNDVLRDSVAHFALSQRELPWTCTAYALYGIGSWTNRDGEQFTLDQLVQEILSRRLDGESCGGVHSLMALTAVLRVDSDQSCITASTRQSIQAYLRSSVRKAVEGQSVNGSWPLKWYNPESLVHRSADSDMTRLVVTGHLTEWMQYLPVDLQPEAEVYRRAVRWLDGELQRTPNELDPVSFCPWTHAVCSMKNLVRAGELDQNNVLGPTSSWGFRAAMVAVPR